MSVSPKSRAARLRIDDFGPVPSLEQQIMTRAVMLAAMLCISGLMHYFDWL